MKLARPFTPFTDLVRTSNVSQQLHERGYAAVKVHGSISAQLGQYQNLMKQYLTSTHIAQIKQDLQKDSRFNVALPDGGATTDYMGGKNVLVFKSVMNSGNAAQRDVDCNDDVVSSTQSIYKTLCDVMTEIHDRHLCSLHPHIARYTNKSAHFAPSSNSQNESGFFANNEVDSLTIYDYMSTADCPLRITDKSSTAHFDSDLLTAIVVTPDIDGLEVANSPRDDARGLTWEPVTYQENSSADLIVFPGALLQVITDQYYSALVHRVQRRSQARRSIVYKLKGDADVPIMVQRGEGLSATNVSCPAIPFEEGELVKDFSAGRLGSWSSRSRMDILLEYLEADELEVYALYGH